jgi:hypothetical protein
MSDSRYDDIMRRIAERRAQQQQAPQLEVQQSLARLLDSVDAMGKLETLSRSRPLRRTTFGPKAYQGLQPHPWVGVVVWRRDAGYHGYKHLNLIGVWAFQEADTPYLTVATKPLKYTARGYEAEAYHKLIKKNFDLYYRDDGSPPSPASRRYTVAYDPAERLSIRQAIRDELNNLLSAQT